MVRRRCSGALGSGFDEVVQRLEASAIALGPFLCCVCQCAARCGFHRFPALEPSAPVSSIVAAIAAQQRVHRAAQRSGYGCRVREARVAPDTAFDAAWDTLRGERHAHITSRISIHDARCLFRAVWSSMVGAVNPNEAERSARLRAAAAKLVK